MVSVVLSVGLALSLVPGAASVNLVDAVPPPVAFPPGVWKGVGVGTGGINAAGAAGFIAEPIIVHFEVVVAPDGAVVNGVWDWAGEISVAAEGVEGTFALTASGPLAGSGARVELSGLIHMSGSVRVQGNDYPIEQDLPAAGAFSPSSVSCNVVSGDLATEGRQLQEAAGVATTVTGPFTAHRIEDPGDESVAGFEETYTELVMTAQSLLATGQPPASDVVAFVERAEDFYTNLYASLQCRGATPGLLPGQHLFAYFAELVGQLIVVMLADPSAYSTSDVHTLAIAAIRIGVVGDSAPDPQLAEQVRNTLLDALSAKLADAEATENHGDCTIVSLAASAMGFTELAIAGTSMRARLNVGRFATALTAGAVVATLIVNTGDSAASVPSTTTTATPTSAPVAADQPGQAIDLGLAPLQLLEPATTAAGNRPTFRWSAVEGATSYLLAILDAANEPVWAWQGTATEVILGGWDQTPPDDAPGPLITGPGQWFVVAVGADGVPIANSVLRPITP